MDFVSRDRPQIPLASAPSQSELPLFFAPIEPLSANPILRQAMGKSGAHYVTRPKILPQHLLKAKKWQFWERIPSIHNKSVNREKQLHDGFQMIARSKDPIKPAVKFLSDNASALGIDFIDLNFCCPGYKVLPQKRGGELLRDPNEICKVIEEVVKYSDLPISIKIRRGYTINDSPAPLLKRITKDFGASIRWATVNRAPVKMQGVKIRQLLRDVAPFIEAWEAVEGKIPIIANGGIDSVESASEIAQHTPASGIMIGREALGNPYLFKEISASFSAANETPKLSLIEKVHKNLEIFFDTASEYTTGNRARWITIGELKRHLYYFLKYYYESQRRPLPPGMGFNKWNKTHFSPKDLKSTLEQNFPPELSEHWNSWFQLIHF